jgi:hypothetical protein
MDFRGCNELGIDGAGVQREVNPMKLIRLSIFWVLLSSSSAMAHHAIAAKFDEAKPVNLEGAVTLVDWKNPHAHLFMDVRSGSGIERWAIELESPVDLARSGWNSSSVRSGDAIKVQGIAARDGSRQAWAKSVILASTGKRVLDVSPAVPPPLANVRPVPRWPDGQPRLGPAPGATGYWAFPSATALLETGVKVAMDANGLLRNIADADKIAPLQRWARDLFVLRQRNQLKDDPMFLYCKPPGGPRQYQLSYGLQFVEDRNFKRIFVLIGSGNRNFRTIYTDGRQNEGQLRGDADNPLYYGRSVGKWEGDTLVVDSSGFNERFWFSNGGLPHTEQLHLTERFSRPDFDTLKYEVTINDPGAYTRPWASGWTLRWVAGEELPIYFCQENRP